LALTPSSSSLSYSSSSSRSCKNVDGLEIGELEGSGDEGRTGDEVGDKKGRGDEFGRGDAGNVDEEGITGDEEGGDDGGIGESLPSSRNPSDALFLDM